MIRNNLIQDTVLTIQCIQDIMKHLITIIYDCAIIVDYSSFSDFWQWFIVIIKKVLLVWVN